MNFSDAGTKLFWSNLIGQIWHSYPELVHKSFVKALVQLICRLGEVWVLGQKRNFSAHPPYPSPAFCLKL